MSTDVNLRSFGPQDSGTQPDFSGENFNGAGFADAIHFSSVTDCYAKFGVVISGDEDAADVNNQCDGVSLEAKKWVLRGTMGLTAKGGSRNIAFSGEVVGSGKETDVDLGNISDQSRSITRGVRLGLWRTDGSPVKVRVLNAEKPLFVEGTGPYKYVFPKPDAWFHGISVWILFHILKPLKLV